MVPKSCVWDAERLASDDVMVRRRGRRRYLPSVTCYRQSIKPSHLRTPCRVIPPWALVAQYAVASTIPQRDKEKPRLAVPHIAAKLAAGAAQRDIKDFGDRKGRRRAATWEAT